MKKCSDKTLRMINRISEWSFYGCVLAMVSMAVIGSIIDSVGLLAIAVAVGMPLTTIPMIMEQLSDIELHTRWKQEWYERINSQIKEEP